MNDLTDREKDLAAQAVICTVALGLLVLCLLAGAVATVLGR